jgi:hypothetical protein
MAKILTKSNEIPTLKVGVYGAAGQGKTTLLAGFNQDLRTAPCLWLNCAGNPNMLLRNGQLEFALDLVTAEDLLSPLSYLLSGQSHKHEFYRKFGEHFPDQPFKSLVIDTFSDWQGLLIDSIVGIKSDKLGTYNIMKVETPSPTKHGKDIAGKTLFAARQMLIALDVHVFIGFQEFTNVVFDGNETGQITRGGKARQISLWGQSRMRVPTWLNLMGRMYWEAGVKMEEVEIGGKTKRKQVRDDYVVIAWQDPEAHVKNQVAESLGTELKKPTAEKILNLIEEEYK